MNRSSPSADSPARACRRLIRDTRSAALATAMPRKGWPYASLVTVACDTDASPILLLSQLSDHTRNLGAGWAGLAPLRGGVAALQPADRPPGLGDGAR